ncbi:MAG: hypothetical protein GY769_05250 [bacterium]|nr:hypothetical protein [bacterium]
MRPWITLLSAIALTSAACSGPDSRALAGDYSRRHRVFVFHGNEPIETEAEDRLTLRALEEGDLGFMFEITADARQRCAMSGIARARGDAFEYRDRAQGGGCTLQISKLGEEVHIEDIDDSCRGRYCGEGASIGRLAFTPTE